MATKNKLQNISLICWTKCWKCNFWIDKFIFLDSITKCMIVWGSFRGKFSMQKIMMLLYHYYIVHTLALYFLSEQIIFKLIFYTHKCLFTYLVWKFSFYVLCWVIIFYTIVYPPSTYYCFEFANDTVIIDFQF